jgi:plastocyanin
MRALVTAAVIGALAWGMPAGAALAQQAVDITISVKNNKFDPAEIEVPAGTPVRLKVKNLDPKPMEFESKELRVEKIITGNSEATFNIRGQKPGRYEFFDEFHEETTRGTLVVK